LFRDPALSFCLLPFTGLHLAGRLVRLDQIIECPANGKVVLGSGRKDRVDLRLRDWPKIPLRARRAVTDVERGGSWPENVAGGDIEKNGRKLLPL
jgi:hypothetical protein